MWAQEAHILGSSELIVNYVNISGSFQNLEKTKSLAVCITINNVIKSELVREEKQEAAEDIKGLERTVDRTAGPVNGPPPVPGCLGHLN